MSAPSPPVESSAVAPPRAPSARKDTAQPLVQVRSLYKSFNHMGNVLEVLKGIDLEIQGGELLSIVGASGAGKSTLLHCIGTLDLPTSGQIMLDGVELTTLSGPKLARVRNQSIGFVFQFHHLLPEFDAMENVMMPGLIRGDGRKQMRRTVPSPSLPYRPCRLPDRH
jgi:lipoprotein-releasing system ATP-binding protein